MRYFVLFLMYYWAVSLPLAAQIQSSSAAVLKQAAASKKQHYDQTWLKQYPVRSVGPCVMGGRVVDIATTPDWATYYVAYASGGVFKTQNNGVSFQPVFDHQDRLTIGDIAVSEANPQLIWVGTGENNSSRSSYAGFGVYKSTDGGSSWTHCGLENTQHIGRIATHPTDANTVWVASLGALYSHNSDRGVFKSTDGGKTWRKTLYINDSTGVVDLIVNPQNPQQLWAAAWERGRQAWSFKENGSGSGLYYSADGGETWQLITSGLPEQANLGRIGLGICASQPNTLYLVVDNQEETRKEKKADDSQTTGLSLKAMQAMAVEEFMNIDNAELDTFLLKNRFPKKYTAQLIKQEMSAGQYTPVALSEYFKNANNDLFDTQIPGAEVYRSDDFGQNWQKTNIYALEGVFFTYGYYFGQVSVDPTNPDCIYIMGVPVLKSEDGGKNFVSIATYQNDVHADHHVVLVNPQNPNHLLLGNDGGLYVSYDKGENFIHLNQVAVGQFYTVFVDMQKPYNVYGGLQDNGVYKGSSQSEPDQIETWERLMGGDGMFVVVDTTNHQYIYTGFQFGNHFRIDKAQGKQTNITPVRDLGQAALRFNWRTPVVLSKFDPQTVYFCSQYVHKSTQRGDNWQTISPDLTQNLPQGNVPFSSITCFAESPSDANKLLVGTDDGLVHLTVDGGNNWQKITTGLPTNRWVSSVSFSPHQANTLFVTLNGYRNDEIQAYLFRSDDLGQTWTSLQGNLPHEAVNVLVQDPKNASILYVGTDQGCYVSFDGGNNWHFLAQLPNVAVYDMVVHPRDGDLVMGTHGRSIWIADVKPFQNLSAKAENDFWAIDVKTPRFSANWGKPRYAYLSADAPKATFHYFLGANPKKMQISVQNSNQETVATWEPTATQGFVQEVWDLKDKNGNYVKTGQYKAIFSIDKRNFEQPFTIK